MVFSVLSGNATLANDGVTLTYTGAGTVVVAADQAASADGNYAAATEVTATIVVNPVVAAYSAGTVPVASQSSILTATLNFPNGGTLGSLSYLTQGAANLDFIGCSNKKQQKPAKGSLPTSFSCGLKTEGPVPVCSVGTAYSAGQICTVSYIFQPTHPGQRLGAVSAVDTNGNSMGMSYLSGVGTGPQVFFPGNQTTYVLGSGLSTPLGAAGVAVDAQGNVYLADSGNNVVKEVLAVGGSIPAANPTILTLATGFDNPGGVAVDGAGNVYVADSLNNAVKEIVAVGGSIPASNPAILTLGTGFNFPVSVAVDSANNIVVSDAGNNSIKVLVAVGGSVPATNPTVLNLGNHFSAYQGIAVDGAGNVFISAYGYGNVTFGEIPLATPPSVAFADTNVGSASSDSPQTVTVGNNGYDPTSTNPLSLSGVSTGTTSFVLDASNACSTSTSLEPGQTCALAVDFTPQTYGTPLTDAVTLADNNLNNILSASSPQTVPLSGNGLQQTPGVTVSPASITYGTSTVALSATVSFVGSIAPTGAVTFTIDSGSAVVASCTGTTSPLTCTATYPSSTLGVPTHTITAGIAATPGFLGSSGTNTLTVTPAALTVTAGSYTGVYDGNIHGLSDCVVSSNPDGLTCTNSPVGPVGPDAGQALVTPVITGSTANYSVTTNNGAWTITALPVAVSAGEYSGVYDGTAHSLTSCANSYGGVTCSNSPASVGPGVGAGTVTPVVSYATGIAADYQITPANGAWSITQATSVTTLTCPTSVVYNGTAQTSCTATVTGAGGLSQSVTVTYSANTIVGTASASATFAGDTNHTGSTKSTTFAITPAPLTVTAGSYSGTYDGSSHALSACVVSSNPDGLTCTNSPASVGPDFGSGTVTVVISGSTSNYSVTKNNGSWSITAKPVTITAGSYGGVYDGSVHAPSSYSNYAGVTCANSPASVGPSVGSGIINPVASFTTGNAADYTVTTVAGAYSITKLAASVTPNAATKVYGTSDPVLTGSLSGFLPADGVTATYSRTAGETVGGSPYTISATLSPTGVLSNYAITSNTAGFTITKATPVLTWSAPSAITYGTALSATQLNATSNLIGGTFAYTPSAGTVLGAGTQTLSVVYTPADTADYTPATTTVPLTVGQATPVVTWANPPSIVYGTGTGPAQKTATATGVGGVSLPGSYFYTTPDGTIFGVGTHPLGVAFLPTDSTDYVPV